MRVTEFAVFSGRGYFSRELGLMFCYATDMFYFETHLQLHCHYYSLMQCLLVETEVRTPLKMITLPFLESPSPLIMDYLSSGPFFINSSTKLSFHPSPCIHLSASLSSAILFFIFRIINMNDVHISIFIITIIVYY